MGKGKLEMNNFWVALSLGLVIASLVVAILAMPLAAAMYLVLLAIFIVLFMGVKSPW